MAILKGFLVLPKHSQQGYLRYNTEELPRRIIFRYCKLKREKERQEIQKKPIYISLHQ